MTTPVEQLRTELAERLEAAYAATGDPQILQAWRYLVGMAGCDHGAKDDSAVLAELDAGATVAEVRARHGLDESDLRRIRYKRKGPRIRPPKQRTVAA